MIEFAKAVNCVGSKIMSPLI